jgi:hypothetical protein
VLEVLILSGAVVSAQVVGGCMVGCCLDSPCGVGVSTAFLVWHNPFYSRSQYSIASNMNPDDGQ